MKSKFKKIKKNDHFIASSDAYMTRSITTYFDYTFTSHRNMLSTTNLTLGFKQPKNYLFDLIQTFELNAELLNQTIKNMNDIKERNEINLIFEIIKSNYNKKKELRKKIKDIKSKLLIELQIFSEFKRKKEENAEYYKEQIKENEENYYSKEEYIRIFQKKLKEVEIYVHKRTKLLNEDKQFYKYNDWKIKDFLEESDFINKKKEELNKDILNLYKNIKEIKKENKLFREDFYQTEDERRKINSEQEQQIKLYTKKYTNQIRVISMRIKLLKNYFNNLNKTLKYLNLDKKIKIEKKK